VIASTKSDIFNETYRGRKVHGDLWVFDPNGAERFKDLPVTPIKWSPVQRADTWDHAEDITTSIVGAVYSREAVRDPHWRERTRDVLAPMLFAAHLGGYSIRDVARWAGAFDLEEVATILNEPRHKPRTEGARIALEGVMNTPDREKGSIFSTLQTALRAYRRDSAQSITSGHTFDARAFVHSRDTLYLVAPEEHQEWAAPIITGILLELRQAVYAAYDEAVNAGQAPPLWTTFILDECANIAPIHDLDVLVSQAGGQNLHVIACFQDLFQMDQRWGHGFGRAALNKFPQKIIFGGDVSGEAAELISRAAGEYDHHYETTNTQWRQPPLGRPNSGWYETESEHVERRRNIPVDKITNMEPAKVLVINSGRPGWVMKAPWWTDSAWQAMATDIERSYANAIAADDHAVAEPQLALPAEAGLVVVDDCADEDNSKEYGDTTRR
jgi:type IV secretory pathway TraG/TraD family ATPase VirD4